MKALLKLIFPRPFLKRMFLLYNRAKIATIDRIAYGTYELKPQEVLHECKLNPFIALNPDTGSFDNDIKQGFARWTDPSWTQDEYIVDIKEKIKIDPDHGWAVVGTKQLVFVSLGFSSAPYVRKPDWLLLRSTPKKSVHFPLIISLRDTGEENYFHFYNDILPKIWLLQQYHHFPPEATIVVSEKLWKKSYFQHFVQLARLRDLNWHVQKEEWVTADRAVFCKPLTHTKSFWDRVARLPRTVSQQSPVKIFLTRSKSTLRYLENEREVARYLESIGFMTIDAGAMVISDQINLFANASVVVAVHGSGISNIVFSRHPLHLIELFPPNEYLPFHYIMLCKLFNFIYTPVLGEHRSEQAQGGFYVSTAKLKLMSL